MLTPRQRRALQGLAEGETVRETARAMGVGEESVYQFRHRAYVKLGLAGMPSKAKRRRAVWLYFTGEAFRKG
jgi:DNA-binding NarL/FixJ family response regulator